MMRIAVVGSGGAGKSTFARELGHATGLPVHHLDRCMWKSGWIMASDDEEDRILAELVAGDRWIIDGNYGRTMPARLIAADTIVFLDLPRWLCTLRIIRRAIDGMRQGQARPDMADGCIEQGDWEFIKWVWNFPRDSRPAVLDRVQRHARQAVVHQPRSPRQAKRLLREITRDGAI
jgi:adenylate kinase family enzyme